MLGRRSLFAGAAAVAAAAVALPRASAQKLNRELDWERHHNPSEFPYTYAAATCGMVLYVSRDFDDEPGSTDWYMCAKFDFEPNAATEEDFGRLGYVWLEDLAIPRDSSPMIAMRKCEDVVRQRLADQMKWLVES